LKITGKIKGATGGGLLGFTVNATVNGGAPRTVLTKVDGLYTFAVARGDNVRIWPSVPNPYTYTVNANPRAEDCQLSQSPAQCYFYNVQHDEIQDFVPTYTTVFLVHGIGQNHEPMGALASFLNTGPPTLELGRFVVDAGFDFGECAAEKYCTVAKDPFTLQDTNTPCSITAGARKLAQYIKAKAPGDFVLIGYSMGGLVARDLLAHASAYGLTGNTARGLITLGSPHWGYPYRIYDTPIPGSNLPTNAVALCTPLVHDMAGSWNPDTNQANEPLTPFLNSLTSAWNTSVFVEYWLAAAGTICDDPYRRFPIFEGPTGCPTTMPFSDGVVCAASASYISTYRLFPLIGYANGPTDRLSDARYAHNASGVGTAVMFCGTSAGIPLYRPAPGDPLFSRIVETINGH
jgi:pimeloyl-ACP methyl ester carboxylesterase